MSHRKTWFSGALTLAMVAILLIALPAAAEFQTETFTATPGLVIPDAGSPVSSTMTVDLDHYISQVRVYIDVSMVDWSSDLRIWVTSAWDTQVELFHIGEGGEPPGDRGDVDDGPTSPLAHLRQHRLNAAHRPVSIRAG